MQPREAVEGDEAGFAGEDAIELCHKDGLALRGGRATVGLEIAVELPDRRAHGGLGGAVLVREGVELVNQALGMNPAQAVLANIELPGIVTDDYAVAQKAGAWTLPHSAPSVAISTGSGLTFKAAMPSFSRCAVQAC